MATTRGVRTFTITVNEEEMALITKFQREYIAETGDVGIKKATLTRLFLMKVIQEPKAINKLKRLRGKD